MPYPKPDHPDYCPGSEEVVATPPYGPGNRIPQGPTDCSVCGRWIAVKGTSVIRRHAHLKTENRSVMRSTAWSREQA